VWEVPSDERLKNGITMANLQNCVDIIRQLDLKKYSFNDEVSTRDTEKNVIGWIAQDVEKYIPKAVSNRHMFGLKDGKVLNTDPIYKTMYGALKWSVSRIDELEERVKSLETLEERVKMLETR
jgi:hypothetical protein